MSIRCAGVLALVDTEDGRVVAVREDCEHEKMWKALREWLVFVSEVDRNAVPDEKMDGGQALRLVADKMDELEREEGSR